MKTNVKNTEFADVGNISFFLQDMDHCWSVAFYGVETWALQKVAQKYLEISEIWCWGKMEKIRWAKCVRNEV